MMAAKGELKEALESRQRSLKIFQSLVQADPQNVQARQSLAISHIHLGEVLGHPETPNLGRTAEALENYRRASEILKASGDPKALDNVKTRETLKLIEQRISALRARN
jgi:tetratricopeptide (TPR) repeat protein